MMEDPGFQMSHKKQGRDFTRNRKLSFVSVMLVLLQKSAKSLQLVLNELKQRLLLPGMTHSALSQARLKLKHTAFIELNQKAIVEVFYEDPDYLTWKGHRLLAVDGTRLLLPDSESVREKFGTQKIANQHESCQGEFPLAIASVLYDVLNHIGLDAQLADSKAYEVNLAVKHLPCTQSHDLILFDRGYLSLRFLAELSSRRRDFLIRAPRNSFHAVNRIFQEGQEDQVVTLQAPSDQHKELHDLNLPTRITVRLLRVLLSTGEVEVLVTSLLNPDQYPFSDFKDLYYQRWGIETFYATLKGRLSLENFTGKSAEAVKQDFFATLYLCGLESILTREAQQTLNQKTAALKHPQLVNQAVAFNAIKNRVFELFASPLDNDSLFLELTQLFLTNPVLARKDRSPQRKQSLHRSYNYQKRLRKFVF